MEAGKEPNFIFIIENNVQDPHASNPSASAGKYLVSTWRRPSEGAVSKRRSETEFIHIFDGKQL